MKVAELREKAKEFEIETTGKKKAELVEEIYVTAAKAEGFRDIKGILQIRPDSSGIIHAHGYMKSNDDAFVPAYLIRSARLRTGDVIEGSLRPSRGGDKRAGLAKITTVNGLDPEQIRNRPKFGDLTPVYPNEPLRMEHGKDSITGRAIDIVSPIGKGQRGLIVSPPKAGKTTILKKICQSISINNPEVHLICLLVDERPEEVTDMQRSIKGEVVASTFDMPADNHTRVAELVIERAKRIVELGGDVVVVLDSITRLARAYNLAAPASGRILSGGVDSAALYPPKRFLGAARNIENGGSLTILASALIDTGSKMDEVIFEEFKGTGNMELKLDRDLADRLGLKAGDMLTVSLSDTKSVEIPVEGVFENYVYHYAYMTAETYERIFGESCTYKTAYLLTQDDAYTLGASIADNPRVANVSVVDSLRELVRDMMKSLDYIVGLVIGSACALALVVLFNLCNISITERIREIATVKVLGFYRRETRFYVFREILMLSVLGALVGLPAGWALHRFIMSQIRVDMVSFLVRVTPLSYCLSFVITMLLSILVCALLGRKIDRIQMAESLKSVE